MRTFPQEKYQLLLRALLLLLRDCGTTPACSIMHYYLDVCFIHEPNTKRIQCHRFLDVARFLITGVYHEGAERAKRPPDDHLARATRTANCE